MQIEERDEPARVIAARRATVRMDGLAEFFDSAFGAVMAAVASAGGQAHGPAIAWYGGMPTDTVDVAAGFPVDGLAPGPLTDGVEVVEIPGSRAAVGLHVGPYDQLPQAWGEVERWRAANDVRPRGDFSEVYLTEPGPDVDPATLETLLVLPLA